MSTENPILAYVKLAPLGTGYEVVLSQFEEHVPAPDTLAVLTLDPEGLVRADPVHTVKQVVEWWQAYSLAKKDLTH